MYTNSGNSFEDILDTEEKPATVPDSDAEVAYMRAMSNWSKQLPNFENKSSAISMDDLHRRFDSPLNVNSNANPNSLDSYISSTNFQPIGKSLVIEGNAFANSHASSSHAAQASLYKAKYSPNQPLFNRLYAEAERARERADILRRRTERQHDEAVASTSVR